MISPSQGTAFMLYAAVEMGPVTFGVQYLDWCSLIPLGYRRRMKKPDIRDWQHAAQHKLRGPLSLPSVMQASPRKAGTPNATLELRHECSSERRGADGATQPSIFVEAHLRSRDAYVVRKVGSA